MNTEAEMTANHRIHTLLFDLCEPRLRKDYANNEDLWIDSFTGEPSDDALATFLNDRREFRDSLPDSLSDVVD